jgi:hypothetical protein
VTVYKTRATRCYTARGCQTASVKPHGASIRVGMLSSLIYLFTLSFWGVEFPGTIERPPSRITVVFDALVIERDTQTL